MTILLAFLVGGIHVRKYLDQGTPHAFERPEPPDLPQRDADRRRDGRTRRHRDRRRRRGLPYAATTAGANRWRPPQMMSSASVAMSEDCLNFGPATGPNSRGACHGSEINYVFDNLYATNLPWTDADRAVADTLSDYVVNFVTHGDPNGHGLGLLRRARPGGHGQG
ncbi:carboxylesterase family protein [Streptomyces hokutonensis]|uniref:carboxylesterase family protein n=1 Tax=Streptomyces hokutonensis TaxID=1306990 RepID=UPI0036C7E00C